VRKKVRRVSLRFSDSPPDPTGLGTILEKNGTGRFWQVLVQDPDPAAVAALRQRPDLTDVEDVAVSLEEVYTGLMSRPSGPSESAALPPMVRRMGE
jgi:ABC-2 type transport system ATP-binding protein